MVRSKIIVLPVLISFLLGFHFEANTQSLEYGLTTGLNLSNHTETFRYNGNLLTPEMAIGFQAAPTLQINITQSFSTVIEPTLILLGAKYNQTVNVEGTTLQTESRTNLLYLQLPLLFKISTIPKGKSVYGRPLANNTYHLFGGPWGGYLLDARFKGTNTDRSSFEHKVSQNIIGQYSRYDAGAMIGIGMEHRRMIGIESRFQYTLLQTYNSNPRIKPENYAFLLSLYYLL